MSVVVLVVVVVGGSSNAAQPDIEVSIVSKSLKVPGSTHHRVSSSLGGNSRLMIGGLSQDSFDGNGFLTHVKITIPTNTLGMSFNLSNNIEQIAEHEMGHALGLGHANFVGDLMFPIANFQTGSISQCDVSAVLDDQSLEDGRLRYCCAAANATSRLRRLQIKT